MSAKTDEPHFLDSLHRDLALALGDAVWAFARIEWLTYHSLRVLSPGRVDELVGDLSYVPRVAILRRMVERKDTSSEKKARALAALNAAEKLSEQRNIIVHNPWQIWIDLDAERFMTEIQKYTKPGKTVDLAKLKAFTESCGRTEVELRVALNAM